MDRSYTAEERHALERALAEGRLACPRCSGSVEMNPVPVRPDVAYVRDRLSVTCPRCRATTVLDRRRIGPRP